MTTWVPAFAGMTLRWGRVPGTAVVLAKYVWLLRKRFINVIPAKAGTHDMGAIRLAIGIPTIFAKEPSVYILASRPNGVLYVGVSSEPWHRVNAHKQGLLEGFTKKYGAKTLVYIEFHDSMEAAILREKRIKKWNRAWKVRLIVQMNPEWRDLWQPSGEILACGPGGQMAIVGIDANE